MGHKNKKNLLDLLPQTVLDYPLGDKRAVSSGFRTLSMVLSITESALTKIISKDFIQFDGIVGNTNCRFVAFRNWCSFSSDEIYREAEALLPFIKKLITLTADLATKNLTKGPILGDLLKNSEYSQPISEEMYYAILLHGCYLAKGIKQGMAKSDYQLLMKYAPENTPRKIVKKMLCSWQKSLAQELIDVSLRKCNCLSDEDRNYYETLIKKNLVKDSFGRVCSPAFFDMKLILHVFRKTPGAMLAVLVNLQHEGKIVERVCVAYRVVDDEIRRIDESELTRVSESAPVFVIGGYSLVSDKNLGSQKLRENFVKNVASRFSLEEVVLANYAHYPLYPGSVNQHISFDSLDVSDLSESQRKLVNKKVGRFKRHKGFDISDYSKFCINHIFTCKCLELQVGMVESPYNLPKCKGKA